MKKLITICLLLASTFAMNAQQESNLEQRKMDLFVKISDILREPAKVYTSSGKYNQITDWKFEAGNNCYFRFYSYDSPIKPGTERNKEVGWQITWIDFSKIKYITSGTTNFGYDCIVFYGQPNAIKVQSSEYDDYGNNSRRGSIDDANEVTIPISGSEMVELFGEYSRICIEESESDPSKFKGLLAQQPTVVKERTADQLLSDKKERRSNAVWLVLSLAAGLVAAHFIVD